MKLAPDVMTYSQAARLIGVPAGTVYSWVSQKRIPHIRLGPRLVRFRRDEIEAWLEEHRVPSAAGCGGNHG